MLQNSELNTYSGGVNGDLVKSAMAKSSRKGTFQGLKSTDVKTIIKSMGPQIAQALPKHISADRIIQIATTYISNNPAIADCSASSIIGAIMQCSILGLEPLAALGQVYFVPYKGQVKFQLGYKGYIKLAQNSNEIKMIYAEVVKEGDVFEFELGLDPKLKHIPNADASGYEKLKYAYAVVHYKSGGYNFVVLTRNSIESLRLRSPGQKSNPSGAWETDYEAMSKAKAIKQLAKYMPLSVEIQKAFATDEAAITEKAFTNNNNGIDINNIEFMEQDVNISDDNSKDETLILNEAEND